MRAGLHSCSDLVDLKRVAANLLNENGDGTLPELSFGQTIPSQPNAFINGQLGVVRLGPLLPLSIIPWQTTPKVLLYDENDDQIAGICIMTEEVPPLDDAQERKRMGMLVGISVAVLGTVSGLVLVWIAPWLYQEGGIMVAAVLSILAFFPVLYLIRRPGVAARPPDSRSVWSRYHSWCGRRCPGRSLLRRQSCSHGVSILCS